MPGVGCCCNKYLQEWKWPWNWAVGRGWENFKTHHRKRLDFLEHIVSRDMNANTSATEDSEEVRSVVEKTYVIVGNA